MITSRQKILTYIRKHQTASVLDISRAMKMTPANARHHLSHLEADGLIVIVGRWRRETRGRPARVYGLSRALMGDNLDKLSCALFEEWLANLLPKKQDEYLHNLARRLAQTIKTNHANQNAPIPWRLIQAVESLNELNYHARWEAGAVGPNMILGYCPYSAIINDQPALCKMDAFLLEEWIGLPVQQTVKLQTNSKGLPFCEFCVDR